MFLLIRMSGIVFIAATVMPHLFGCVATQRVNLREADIACMTASSAGVCDSPPNISSVPPGLSRLEAPFTQP